MTFLPSFLPPPTSPLLTHPAARGAALLCHMCNKWASQWFVHACILQGTRCKSLTPARLWVYAEFQKNVCLIFFLQEKNIDIH